MEATLFWFGLAGLAIVIELLTGTFYLLMIAIGLAAGGIAALVVPRGGWPIQLLVGAAVAACAIGLLRRSRFGRRVRRDPARDAGVNLDIGEVLRVDAWQSPGRTRAMYRGAEWDVELLSGEPAEPGWFEIREVRGNRLMVAARR